MDSFPGSSSRAHAVREQCEGLGSVSSTAGQSVEDLLVAAEAAPTGAEREELLAEVVIEELPLARRVATRYRNRGQPLEDLVQIASMALVLAVKRYRPGAGCSFEAYAVPTITGELRRSFREQGWSIRPPRRLQELRPRLAQAAEVLSQRLCRQPTAAELAEHLDVPAEDVLEAELAGSNYRQLSLDAPSRLSTEVPVSETLGQDDARLEWVLRRASAGRIMAQLEARERRVLVLRYLQEWTQQQIAEDIGVTQMQVSRILSHLQTRLRRMATTCG